jgi:hypothetical protein
LSKLHRERAFEVLSRAGKIAGPSQGRRQCIVSVRILWIQSHGVSAMP